MILWKNEHIFDIIRWRKSQFQHVHTLDSEWISFEIVDKSEFHDEEKRSAFGYRCGCSYSCRRHHFSSWLLLCFFLFRIIICARVCALNICTHGNVFLRMEQLYRFHFCPWIYICYSWFAHNTVTLSCFYPLR